MDASIHYCYAAGNSYCCFSCSRRCRCRWVSALISSNAAAAAAADAASSSEADSEGAAGGTGAADADAAAAEGTGFEGGKGLEGVAKAGAGEETDDRRSLTQPAAIIKWRHKDNLEQKKRLITISPWQKERGDEKRGKTDLLWDLVSGLRAGKSKRRVNRHRELRRAKGQPPR
jgi:hypothetical protein